MDENLSKQVVSIKQRCGGKAFPVYAIVKIPKHSDEDVCSTVCGNGQDLQEAYEEGQEQWDNLTEEERKDYDILLGVISATLDENNEINPWAIKRNGEIDNEFSSVIKWSEGCL